MLTIYAIPASLYCAKLRILLRHKGLQWREIPPPGGYGSAAYKRIVPSGNLPALEDEGLLIGDSEAIAEYLEERYPDPPMLPATSRARAMAREFSRFHDTRLEPELRKLFAQIAPEGRNRTIVAAQSVAITARLSQLAQLLQRQTAVKSRALSLGDCGFAVTFIWIDSLKLVLDLDIAWPQTVIAYRSAIEQIPAVRDELASYRPALDAWLSSEAAS